MALVEMRKVETDILPMVLTTENVAHLGEVSFVASSSSSNELSYSS